jgi:hypothetical protein
VSNFGPFMGRIGVLSQNFTLFEVRIVLDALIRDLAGSRLDPMLSSVVRAGDEWLKPGDQASDCRLLGRAWARWTRDVELAGSYLGREMAFYVWISAIWLQSGSECLEKTSLCLK